MMTHSEHYNTPFQERFSLMIQSGQVDLSTINLVLEIIRKIERDYNLTLDEDNAASFVSHVTLALQRLKDAKPLKDYPDVLLNEARAMPSYWAYAGEINKLVAERLGKHFDQGEVGYLTIHLARLAQGQT